ncbi:uncharacterized protein LOC132713574 [Ruditapes philippinarum]|uniref:uncharacterized protein LOC132713574 n=1 Tax=Ruditapes philippinarum TaxID=129788 RepID=UPI00295B3D37|nr:uncharacterized protein LOC132713574 [Ruditapes philippinarum]
MDASKRESDVTSEESEDDDNGYYLIPETRVYGDAHKSKVNISEEKVEETNITLVDKDKRNGDTDLQEVSVEIERPDNRETEQKKETKASSQIIDVRTESLEQHIERDEENILEEHRNLGHIDKTTETLKDRHEDTLTYRTDTIEEEYRHTDIERRQVENENESVEHKEETDNRNLRDRSKRQLEERLIEPQIDINNTVEVTDTETDTTLGETDTQTQTKQLKRNTNRKRLLPPDPPRRSDRARKPPKRYEDFQMYGIVNTSTTPYDSRFKALETLIGSGVLQTMDIDTARKIVTSLMS